MKYSIRSIERGQLVFALSLISSLVSTSCSLVADRPTSLADTAALGTPAAPGDDSGLVSPPPATPADASVLPVVKQQINLATTLKIPVTIQSQNGYAGPIELALDTKTLSGNDPMGMVSVTLAPATLDVTAGGSVTATITVKTAAGAPDFTSYVNLLVTTPAGQVVSQIPVEVMPVLEVDLLSSVGVSGAKNEEWALSDGTPFLPSKGGNDGNELKLTQHTAGLTLNFVSMDQNAKNLPPAKPLRIHSSVGSLFVHQAAEGLALPGTTAPVTNDAKTVNSNLYAMTKGDMYTVIVTSQTTNVENSTYDHNNENPGIALRYFDFNFYPAPKPVPTPTTALSGNLNATYTYLSKNLFTVACMSCHISQTSGGVSLANYASVFKTVHAGDASVSELYTAVAAGGTMPQGNPGSTSPALLQDLKDWIDDGALNN